MPPGPRKEKTDILRSWIHSARTLPIRFQLTRLSIIGKRLFKNSFVGDPSTKAWLVPVNEEIESGATGQHQAKIWVKDQSPDLVQHRGDPPMDCPPATRLVPNHHIGQALF